MASIEGYRPLSSVTLMTPISIQEPDKLELEDEHRLRGQRASDAQGCTAPVRCQDPGESLTTTQL